MEQMEYPPMSGSNTICVTTVLLETGILPMREPVTELTLEAPAGLIRVRAECRDGKVVARHFPQCSRLRGSPRRAARGAESWHPDRRCRLRRHVLRHRRCRSGGIAHHADEGADIVRLGEMIKAAAREQLPAVHPDNPAIDGVTSRSFRQRRPRRAAHEKHGHHLDRHFDWDNPATWTGVLDRSACGPGTCAKMATLHAKGRLALNTDFVHESILGTTFTGRLIEETRVGPYPAVVPTITGQAWIYGISQYLVDPTDPSPRGSWWVTSGAGSVRSSRLGRPRRGTRRRTARAPAPQSDRRASRRSDRRRGERRSDAGRTIALGERLREEDGIGGTVQVLTSLLEKARGEWTDRDRSRRSDRFPRTPSFWHRFRSTSQLHRPRRPSCSRRDRRLLSAVAAGRDAARGWRRVWSFCRTSYGSLYERETMTLAAD